MRGAETAGLGEHASVAGLGLPPSAAGRVHGAVVRIRHDRLGAQVKVASLDGRRAEIRSRDGRRLARDT